MALGTTSIDGLISGLDTTSIIQSLASLQRRPVILLQNRITQRSSDLKAYQSLAAQVGVLRSAAESLADGTVLQARSISVSDTAALVASTRSGAALGDYEVVINHLAQSHKLSSTAVADTNADLGFTGDIRLNGHTISLQSGDDLAGLRDQINQAGAGVSASIVTVSPTDHRLVLRSLQTGVDNAIDLSEASGGDLLRSLGLLNGVTVTKHGLTNGMASDTLSSQTGVIGDSLDLSAPPSGTIRINGTEVAVDLSADSLQDLATRITATVAGVTAVVTADSSSGATRYRLELTGAAAPTLTDDQGVLQALGVLRQGVANELAAARDAEIEVDGATVTRASNSIDDVLEGISLDLLRADEGKSITLSVGANTQAAVSAVQLVVSSYNAIINTLNAGQTFDTETHTGGVFFTEASALMLQSGLHDRAMSPAATLGGDLTTMSQIGMGTDRYGLLTVNAATLQRVLQDDPQGVLRLLTSQAETTSDEVEYVSSETTTADSGRAGYAVQITQVATKGTAQSATLAAGLTQDETLTINGQYAVQLTAGMTLQQAADKLNTVLEGNKLTLRASVADDRLQLQSTLYGSNYGFSVSSSLADGAGGTDLGGATAGTLQITYGQNVAGTIGGKQATGWGQWLTGAEGGVEDLKLKITSATAGSKGVVQLSQGFGTRLAGYAAQTTATDNGLLTRATQSISNNIEQLSDGVDRLNESVNTYVTQMQLKFATLEGVLAKNKALQSYLTTQLDGLSGLSVSRNA